jgi:hypothetical protein
MKREIAELVVRAMLAESVTFRTFLMAKDVRPELPAIPKRVEGSIWDEKLSQEEKDKLTALCHEREKNTYQQCELANTMNQVFSALLGAPE